MDAGQDLDQQILGELAELMKEAGGVANAISSSYGLTGSDVLALLKIDSPIPMKELGTRLGCDPSFVTAVADTLEKGGFVRREPSLRDRRSKTLVLTEEGTAVREQVMQEVASKLPWCTRLDVAERTCFLTLIRKMLGRTGPAEDHASKIQPTEGDAAVTSVPAATSYR